MVKLLLAVTAEVLASNGADVAVRSFNNEVEHNGLNAGGHVKSGAESYQSFLDLAPITTDQFAWNSPADGLLKMVMGHRYDRLATDVRVVAKMAKNAHFLTGLIEDLLEAEGAPDADTKTGKYLVRGVAVCVALASRPPRFT